MEKIQTLQESKATTTVTIWRKILTKYQQPQNGKALWQMINSIIPYFLILYLMYRVQDISYWFLLPLAIFGAGFLTRIFIICHDCGHNNFFKSKKANNIVGWFTGLMTFTPFNQWRHDHAVHHATSGDLDRRGVGEIWTMTVKEYEASSFWRRLQYRIYRNPFILFGVGAWYYFLVRNRFSTKSTSKAARRSVFITNLIMVLLLIGVNFTIGFSKFILILGPIFIIALGAGVWLFYVQHQFEDTYWTHHDQWDYFMAALQGSSYYQMPRILQWFTGNIGFHHIHHLSPRIPNYRLAKCHHENKIFRQIKPVTLRSSLKALKFRLWDEEQFKLVGFKRLNSKS